MNPPNPAILDSARLVSGEWEAVMQREPDGRYRLGIYQAGADEGVLIGDPFSTFGSAMRRARRCLGRLVRGESEMTRAVRLLAACAGRTLAIDGVWVGPPKPPKPARGKE